MGGTVLSISDYITVQAARNAELRLSEVMAHIAVKASLDLRPNTKDSAAYNVECVRSYLETHLGASRKEVARALGISHSQAIRAVEKLRSEWK